MQGEQEDIDNAVGAAREAFKSWSKLPGHVRARYLYSVARHVQKHARLIAVLESMDNGKPIRETRDADVQIVARHLYHHAGWAQLMDTEMRGKWLTFLGFRISSRQYIFHIFILPHKHTNNLEEQQKIYGGN